MPEDPEIVLRFPHVCAHVQTLAHVCIYLYTGVTVLKLLQDIKLIGTFFCGWHGESGMQRRFQTVALEAAADICTLICCHSLTQ